MVRAVGLAAFAINLVQLPRLGEATGIHKEMYTNNAICRQKACINPIFPGLEDLHRLSEASWYSTTLQKAAPSMNFCRGAVSYNPALPRPEQGGATLASVVKQQDSAATTMFFYHLSGMGLEAWDHTFPADSDDECIKSVWRLACYTYFPKAQVGVAEGQASTYLRPCQSSCFNYVRTCQVECCDESVQCVFTHTKMLSPTKSVQTSGYVSHDGPSSLCTGAATRSGAPSFLVWLLLAAPLASTVGNGLRSMMSKKYVLIPLLAAAALALQGSTLKTEDFDIPTHNVGRWRAQPDYLISFEFIPPGGSAADAKLNSCSLQRLAQTLQCSGRGVCKAWDADNLNNQLSFCECDRDWADPECRTPRKSQLYAYVMSLFLGIFGVDQFYLGFPLVGTLKLATLGGCGFWWLLDIVRIGSAPVYSNDFRLAADLPHWAFVLVTLFFAFTIGFSIMILSTLKHRRQKRMDMLLTQAREEEYGKTKVPELAGAAYGAVA